MDQFFKSFAEIAISSPVWVRVVILAVLLAAGLYVFFKSTKLGKSWLPVSFSLFFFKVQLLPSEDAENDPFDTGYHKLQYVKVLALTERGKTTEPVYTRCVGRLNPGERNVAVFDEAVYYTLERFPKKKKLDVRTNRSGGVIDARLIVPWEEKLFFPDRGAATVPNQINFSTMQETDTFLSVCHYENGLQGDSQDFSTRVYEKTNDARLIVDMSSIPSITEIVVDYSGQINRADHMAREDAEVKVLSPGVYTITCKDACADDALVMNFTFDRTRAARPAGRLQSEG